MIKNLIDYNLKNEKVGPTLRRVFFIIFGILSYDIGQSIPPRTHRIFVIPAHNANVEMFKGL